MDKRGSGILLHITSLPSSYGIGDVGPCAYKFADLLAETKQRFWQALPLNPTSVPNDNSPYSSVSAFACNPLLISPEFTIKDGLLSNADVETIPNFPAEWVDYGAVTAYKSALFRLAYRRFQTKERGSEYEDFCAENTHWLDDFALFVAISEYFQGRGWVEWPLELRDRHPDSLREIKKHLYERIEEVRFLQYLFFRQWFALKNYCNRRGIKIIGDLPIYVSYDSADVWTHPELFKLDAEKRLLFVAGVPPDYFSKTGQRWGNPVYRWDILKERGYEWWIQRMGHNLRLFDLVRIDHFRGLAAYWEIPAGEKTAVNGRWVEAPGKGLCNAFVKSFPSLPIIAEDLGIITQDVMELMLHFGFPGMKVLLFAFGGDLASNPYVPHNHVKNCLVYTGTHDNNTVKGWFEREAAPADKRRLFQYLGREVSPDDIHWTMIRLAMTSVADTVIIPMQDILGLGEKARMNVPSTPTGNWEWRFTPGQLTSQISKTLLEMTEIYGRG